ncbi:hypothetical protein Q765_08585 [Flavobacterium rivuli WB 3.3-2 = DSM 21788]|uniref:Uncharacterized protein n=1 Tax=Flavobacterium rivuli WB 3.3-2 = DSM 21788 TaxID=1121895 RepID=A0A0A2M6B5_9FLAO|nr:hypothetical protein Q765_08585 [Flavobacterium rivuli WB 3.3-2 = DSM 21788]
MKSLARRSSTLTKPLGLSGNTSGNLKIVLRNCTVTFFITLVLAGINCNDKSLFVFFWMRSWLVAAAISNFFAFVIFSNIIRNFKVVCNFKKRWY